ncbi:hypothetical protein HMI55_002071 [Coelomomyces lativittatus]|nr:hypothetical protein HMI55_002071 [Coelomomyces lativittatus]
MSIRMNHANLNKLGCQVTKNLRFGKEEFVSDALIQFHKLPILIEELANIHEWKKKVFFKIEPMLTKEAPILGYALLRHEGILLHLIQATLFKKEITQTNTNALLLLSDTLMNYITWLNTKPKPFTTPASNVETLLHQKEQMDWDQAWLSVSAISHLSYHLELLDIAVMTRLGKFHDVGNQLVYLLCNELWKLDHRVYEEGNWITLQKDEVSKIEGSIWLALVAWFPYFQQELSAHRYDVWIKLLPHCERIYPKLSFIEPMYRQLLQLKMNPPRCFSNHHQGIHELVEWTIPNFSSMSFTFQSSDNQHMAQQLSSAFDHYLDDLNHQTPSTLCQACGQMATHRCSKCKVTWYCCRECQIKDWKSNHQRFCSKLSITQTSKIS